MVVVVVVDDGSIAADDEEEEEEEEDEDEEEDELLPEPLASSQSSHVHFDHSVSLEPFVGKPIQIFTLPNSALKIFRRSS